MPDKSVREVPSGALCRRGFRHIGQSSFSSRKIGNQGSEPLYLSLPLLLEGSSRGHLDVRGGLAPAVGKSRENWCRRITSKRSKKRHPCDMQLYHFQVDSGPPSRDNLTC
jgi:hypothetical protein